MDIYAHTRLDSESFANLLRSSKAYVGDDKRTAMQFYRPLLPKGRKARRAFKWWNWKHAWSCARAYALQRTLLGFGIYSNVRTTQGGQSYVRLWFPQEGFDIRLDIVARTLNGNWTVFVSKADGLRHTHIGELEVLRTSAEFS